MTTFRIAALVAALVTITLNAAYGFKTSTVFEYAVLFAALNAALDIAKCSCLVGASRAWRSGQWLPAILLLLLFWPLLANSLWCGLSEVMFNRAAEAARYAADTQSRDLASAAQKNASDELASLKASPYYKSSTACALQKTNRERQLCDRVQATTGELRKATEALASQPARDPAPQMSLLASLTGFELPALQLAAAFWLIALAELCGSLGFYLSIKRSRAKNDSGLSLFAQPDTATAIKATIYQEPKLDGAPTIRWPTVTP
jgi:hypothetical protein